MYDYSAVFTYTTGGAFPNTLGVNASGPSASDGTEFVKIFIDDHWAAKQDLMVEAGKTPSGSQEAVGSSDFVAALKSLFWFDNLITGLLPANNVTDSDHDIDIATGQAMDSTNAYLLKLTSGLTKQIDASWAVGTNAGGLFTGTVAADTVYGVFIIRKDSDGTIDAGFDTSPTAANIPAGYTAYRRIGWVLTDGSANIIGFNATEESGGSVRYKLDAFDTLLNGVAATAARTSLATGLPGGVIAEFAIRYDYVSVSGAAWVQDANFTDVAPSAAVMDVAVNNTANVSIINKKVLVDSSGDIYHRSSTTGCTWYISTQAFQDYR